MKTTIKLTSLMLIVILVVSVLVGCASKTNAEPEATPTAVVEETPAAPEEMAPADYVGEIDVWTWWQDYFDASIADFNAMYPNVTVNLTTMGWGDYLPKFETAKAAGTGLPDIALAESTWWGKFLGYEDTFVDLTTLGFNKEDLVEAAGNVVVNTEGKFVAIPQGLGVGCIWYRKDLAKEYLGTDDPDELAARFSTWEDFINAGAEVKEKSNGEVYLLTNALDTIEALIGSLKTNGKSYVDGDTLTVAENMPYAFDLLQQALDAGYIAKVDGPAVDAAWASGSVIFFPSAGWREGFIPNQDPEGAGRWSLMMPPGGSYFRGGTAEMIVDNGDETRAQLAGLFLKHRMYSKEGMQVNNDFGNLSGVKAVHEAKLTNGLNDYYGIDITNLFYGWLADMPAAVYGSYDSIIEDSLRAAANDMQNIGISADEAVENAIADIRSKVPELN